MNGIRYTGSQLATKLSASPQFLFIDAPELLPATNRNNDTQSTTSDDEVTLESLPRHQDDDSSLINGPFDYCDSVNGERRGIRGEVHSLEQPNETTAGTDYKLNGHNHINEDRQTEELSSSIASLDSGDVAQLAVATDDCALLLSLLEDCLHQNPVSALANHYMKRGITSGISNSFRMIPSNIPGKTNAYWKAEFTCPLSGQVLESGLASGVDMNSNVQQAAKRAFGDFEFIYNGQIVFSTKKGAKRSVAFAAFHSLGGARRATTPASCAKDFPDWVHELYRLGIKGCNLTISYQEKAGSNTSLGECWDCRRPTLLSCVLQIDNESSSDDTTTTIEGIPQQTKERALEQAIFHVGNTLDPIEKETRRNEQVEKERLLSCNITDAASYAIFLPTWANAPVTENNAVFHVYELEFEAKSGLSLVMERTECTAGPLGIAFPQDIQPLLGHILTFETRDFFLKQSNGTDERIVVRLRKRFVVNVNDGVSKDDKDATAADRISWMKEFSRMLAHFKTYARTRGKPVSSRSKGDEASPSDRTYLFVPLVRCDNEATSIDWDVLERVATRDCRPFVVESQRSPLVVVLLLLASFTLFRQLNCGEGIDSGSKLRNFCFSVIMLVALLFVSETRITLSPEVVMNHFLVQTSITGGEVDLACNVFDAGFSHYLARHFRGYLIPCEAISCNGDSDFLLEENGDEANNVRYIFSRGLELLPMPRHYLSLARYFSTFMPLLEREVELAFASVGLQNLSNEPSEISGEDTLTLASLLREATTLTPKPTYQRLEFLGDAVLGFFVAVMIMAGNPGLKLSYDELGDYLSMSTKNTVLYIAALRIGANHALFSSKRASRWRSQYSGGKFLSKLIRSSHEKIADSVMSDAVESLLGAAFVHDESCGRDFARTTVGSVAAALFRMLQLPVSLDATNQNIDFPSLTLKKGYPFDKDVVWQEQLITLNEMFDEDRDALDDKLHALVRTLVDLSQHHWLSEMFEIDTFNILLTSAIYHDDDAVADATTYVNGKSCDAHGSNTNDSLLSTGRAKLRLCRFREMLSLVGAYTLQLCITLDLSQRYPDANERDLHTLRARAIADDVVVYIMFRAGMHESIFRMDQEVAEAFQLKMIEADMYGREAWKALGGWILPGGVAEFARRRRTSPSTTPQYPGYAGGRLFGNKKKLHEKYTEQHMFAMKAIIGALVLSCGMQRMWECIGPLFDEVMLLSIDESFTVYKDSNVK